jgi:hypothetical protein
MIVKKNFAVTAVLGSVLCLFVCSCAKLPREMMLWDDTGSPGQTLSSAELTKAIEKNCIKHIPDAKLTYFPAKKGNGTAVVVCPGGGYGGVAQRAIRHVRSNADKYGFDAERIGILGFSAGGHLASTTGTHFDYGDKTAKEAIDRVSSRPDFMILVYPVITFEEPYVHKGSRRNLLGDRQNDEAMQKYLSNNLQVTSDTPPNILIHAKDDKGVKVENSILFNQACLAKGVPSELRLYEKGGHGFDLGREGTDSTQWSKDCEDWLRSRDLIK